MNKKIKSLSIIIPAYNEETNLESAVKDMVMAVNLAKDVIKDYEILIFNDCSTDKTGEIADRLAKENKNIRVIHNPKNRGLGYNYRKGTELAKNKFIIMVPGDNEIKTDSVRGMFKLFGRADIIISYIGNPEIRPLSRQLISKAFVKLMNFLFGLRLKYYNGVCLIRKDLLRKVRMTTHGFAYMAEILVGLIRSGSSFIEIPFYLQPRKYGKSAAFRLKNVMSVAKTIIQLFWEVYFKEREKYSKYRL